MNEMNLAGLRPWGGLAGNPLEGADVVVAGIPYDGSAVYRKGAALAPMRMREFSALMPPVTEDARPLDGVWPDGKILGMENVSRFAARQSWMLRDRKCAPFENWIALCKWHGWRRIRRGSRHA